MKKLLLMGLIVCVVQAMAQETPIQKQVNAIPQNLFSKQNLFKAKEITTASASLKNYISKYDLIEADNNVLNKIIDDKIPALEIDITVNNSTFNLQLLRNDKLTDGENLIKTNDGQTLPGITTAYYYGVIKGQPNSLAVITFFRNNIMGTISNKTGNYTLSKRSGNDIKTNEYFIFNEKDLKIKRDFRCRNVELPVQIPNIPSTNSVFGTPYKCLTVYLEVDYPLFQKLGSISNCNAYVNQIKAGLSAVYVNESIGVSFATTVIDSGGDTYGSVTSIFTLSANFKASVGITFPGDLAHLLSARIMSDYTGYGPGQICNASDRESVATNLARLVAAPLYAPLAIDISLVAHEIGHTMGCFSHTNACVWNGNNTAIDGCDGVAGGCVDPGLPPLGGTIMSYCDALAPSAVGIGINLSNGFGIQPGNLIRQTIAGKTCLTDCNSTCGSNVFITGLNYVVPLTESSTWIKTTGATKVNGGTVKLDADNGSYVELNPGFDANSLSSSAASIFIAQAKNGCTVGAPSFTARTSDYSDEGMRAANNDSKNFNSFIVYPNPSTDYFTLLADTDLKNSIIELFDVNGRSQSVIMQSTGKNSKKIMIGNLSKGVYLVKLTTTGKTEFAKVIVQ